MYGYSTTALIIFLTHPGVAYNFFDAGVFGGMFQAVVVLALQSLSEGKASMAATIEIIYWAAFALWAYIKVRLALMGR
jgi:hypothetical protein